MNHIEIIKKHYKITFDNRKSSNHGFDDVVVEYRIIGNISTDFTNEIANILNDLYNLYSNIKKNDKEKEIIQFEYKPNIMKKKVCLESNQSNWGNIINKVKQKKTSRLSVIRYFKTGKANDILGEYAFGNIKIMLDFKNYKEYLDNTNYNKYEITLTMLFSIFQNLSENQKNEIENLWIDSYIRLNSDYFVISHNEDFEKYTSGISSIQYLAINDGEILGCFWSYIFSYKAIILLGGLDVAKEKMRNFIVKDLTLQNGKKALHVKLCNNLEEMTQQNLKEMKNILIDLLPNISLELLNNVDSRLKTLEKETESYEYNLSMLNEMKFVLENILIFEENDIRCK